MPRIVIVQKPPVLLDRTQTIARAASAAREAADSGAELVVFPEAFVPGYPIWVWRLRPGSDMSLSERLHGQLLANAVNLEGDELSPLYTAARERKITVVCGVNERDATYSRSTIFNTVIVIGPDGTLRNRHRKLMPTNPERMVWGLGDASGLNVDDTPVGRLGTLICWESYMPLARFALYAQGVEVYVAPTYDSGQRWLATMQHVAREGACWVLGSGFALRAGDLPRDLPGRAELYPNDDEWINPGDSVVVAPNGKIFAGPLHEEYGVLSADIDLERVGDARRTLDVAGHYGRPDVFQLDVNRGPRKHVTFST